MKVIPDVMLVDLEDNETDSKLVCIEVNHADGLMTRGRLESIRHSLQLAGYPKERCMFGTALTDLKSSGSIHDLARGSFVWHASEPSNLMILR